jgi:hypothetical protein
MSSLYSCHILLFFLRTDKKKLLYHFISERLQKEKNAEIISFIERNKTTRYLPIDAMTTFEIIFTKCTKLAH